MPGNILFILTDDQRYDELRYMPNTRALLAGRGTSFTQGRCNVPLCTPARAAILSGQLSKHNNVDQNGDALGSTMLNNSAFVAIHNAGYRVGGIGKMVSSLYGTVVRPGFDWWRAIVGDGGSGVGVYEPLSYEVFDGTATTSPGVYQDHWLARESLEFITESSEPWCLWCCPTEPHWPWTDPPNHQDEYALTDFPLTLETDVSDKPSWVQALPALTSQVITELQDDERHRLRELRATDDLVGALVAGIDATGQSDTTTIIFASDNGMMLGEHRKVGGVATGRAVHKNLLYEPAMRVPLIVRGPGVPHQRITNVPTILQDITATMLDIAGVPAILPNQAGMSLIDIAADPANPAYTGRTTLHHREKDDAADPFPAQHAIVGDGWKLIRNIGATGTDIYEMYDLAADPDELVNQANDPTKAALLASRITLLDAALA